MEQIKLGDFALASFDDHVKPSLWKVTGYRKFMSLHLYKFTNITSKDDVELSGNAVNAMQGNCTMIIYPNNL